MKKKEDSLSSCDKIANIGIKSRLELIIESVHFIKASHYVSFYELFILLWATGFMRFSQTRRLKPGRGGGCFWEIYCKPVLVTLHPLHSWALAD